MNSDENDGNFYKNVYVQDATGGLCLRLLNSGGLYIGDSIRIYLPGTVLAPYNGLMQLDSCERCSRAWTSGAGSASTTASKVVASAGWGASGVVTNSQGLAAWGW